VKNVIKVYPNPTVNTVNIENNETIDEVLMFDIVGKKVYHKKGDSNIMKIDVSTFAAGTYILRVNIGSKTEIFKIIKE